ncbi:MAG: hypothetical protein U9R58_06280 [Chloroflexota bacterium]|nr:hypothetical protein [Chloroflexota bacterium]
MFSLAFLRVFLRKASISLIFALALGFLTVSFALAVLYNIDTDNNSGSDWDPVGIFQTDDPGDVKISCTGGDGRDDIIETYVASGPVGTSPPTHIYFRVKTVFTDAVSVELHQVAAYIDCPPVGEDDNDVTVMYRAQPAADQVVLGDGHTPQPDRLIFYDPNGPEGERPDDATNTVEWGLPIADFQELDTVNDPPEINCVSSSEARIKFTTYKVHPFVGTYDCYYDDTEFSGFNIPTAVDINSFDVHTRQDRNDMLVISATMFLGAVAIGGLGYLLIRRRNQSL